MIVNTSNFAKVPLQLQCLVCAVQVCCPGKLLSTLTWSSRGCRRTASPGRATPAPGTAWSSHTTGTERGCSAEASAAHTADSRQWKHNHSVPRLHSHVVTSFPAEWSNVPRLRILNEVVSSSERVTHRSLVMVTMMLNLDLCYIKLIYM